MVADGCTLTSCKKTTVANRLMIGSKPLSFFQPPRPPLSVSQANFAVAAAPPALMTVKSVINTQIAPTGRMKPNAVSTKELGN